MFPGICSVLAAALVGPALPAGQGDAAASPAAEGPRSLRGGTLILDTGAYRRYYVRFGPDQIDPAALKAEGDKLLGAAGMGRLARKVKLYFRPPYARGDEEMDWAKADWRDHARVWFPVGQGDGERAALNCQSPPPPDGWAGPDFDAGRWPRGRLPLLVGNVLRPSIMHGDKDMGGIRGHHTSFRCYSVPVVPWVPLTRQQPTAPAGREQGKSCARAVCDLPAPRAPAPVAPLGLRCRRALVPGAYAPRLSPFGPFGASALRAGRPGRGCGMLCRPRSRPGRGAARGASTAANRSSPVVRLCRFCFCCSLSPLTPHL